MAQRRLNGINLEKAFHMVQFSKRDDSKNGQKKCRKPEEPFSKNVRDIMVKKAEFFCTLCNGE